MPIPYLHVILLVAACCIMGAVTVLFVGKELVKFFFRCKLVNLATIEQSLETLNTN